MSQTRPSRRFTFTANVHADTSAQLIHSLREIVDLVKQGRIGSLCGGVGVGYEFQITERPDMTPERYLEELRQWLESQPVPGPQNPPRPEKPNEFT